MTRYVDRTGIFREQVRELARVSPPHLKGVKGKSRQLGTEGDAKLVNDGFLGEAYAIVSPRPSPFFWHTKPFNAMKLFLSLHM